MPAGLAGVLFIYCIKYGRFGELIANLRNYFRVDSKGSYKVFSILPIDKVFEQPVDGRV